MASSEWRPGGPGSSLFAIRYSLFAASQSPQRDLLHHVIGALGQDEVGALPRRQDVLAQIDEIDARPDGGRGLDRLGIGELGVAVEVRYRITEGGEPQGQKSVHIPLA